MLKQSRQSEGPQRILFSGIFESPGERLNRASEFRPGAVAVGASNTKERTSEAQSCRVPLLAHRTMTNYELNSPHCRPIRPYKRRHHRESLFLSTSLRALSYLHHFLSFNSSFSSSISL